MKIAVQIYGHLRTFEKTYKSLQKHLLSQYDCDVFIHTWDELHRSEKHPFRLSQKKLDEKIIKKVHSYYNPKKLLVESQDFLTDKSILVGASGSRYSCTTLKCILYGRYKSNQLRTDYELEKKIKYDWIVVTRPDILFKTPFSIIYPASKQYPMLGGSLDKSIFCGFPNKLRRVASPKRPFSFSVAFDIIFFAKPEPMTMSASQYLAVKNLDGETLQKNYISIEALQYRYTRDQGIDVVSIRYVSPCDWIAMRFLYVRIWDYLIQFPIISKFRSIIKKSFIKKYVCP